jgi:metal-sulfur cluster biosynthetic enzyme
MSMRKRIKSLPPIEQSIYDVLLKIIDPEIGENIVDLGLVYGVEVSENIAKITLTLTSFACPMGDMLLDDIHEHLTRLLPKEMKFDINLVWEPEWSPDMISAEAKQRIGWD